jgi:signal transduction histidine kinase
MELEEVDLGQVVDEVCAGLDAAMRECGARVVHSGLPSVAGDRAQFTQVFQNLLGNAIKFRSSEPPLIDIGARLAGGTHLISVADNGIGIPESMQSRVFDVFERGHPRERYAGTGMGLAICRRALERHGGAIWVENRPEGGSVFWLSLPARQRRPGTRGPAAATD